MNNKPEVGLELSVVGSQAVQFLVGLECFRRQAQGGIVKPEQLCNSHMASGARQIHRPMTHVVLHSKARRGREREAEREENIDKMKKWPINTKSHAEEENQT